MEVTTNHFGGGVDVMDCSLLCQLKVEVDGVWGRDLKVISEQGFI